MASASVARNASAGEMSWSAVRMHPTASGPPALRTRPQAVAAAGAVSRRQGSPTTFSGGSIGSASRVKATKRPAVTTNVRSGGISPARRSTAWRMSARPPKRSRNCFGRSGVESGQKRSPLPPAMMTA